MKSLEDYIVVFDDVLDETACEILIDTYNKIKCPSEVQTSYKAESSANASNSKD